MTDIKMVPIGALLHHPDNPRKDLGDLTELTESIRINGVLQNLTVVHALHYMTDEEWRADTKLFKECPTEELRQRLNTRQYISPNEYWVVIGNRRLEAAKMAGLTELPCVISEMDHKTQVATMLQENMQRQDLTIYEQAKGIQMMMDLGFNKDEISEKTGFSRSTIERRLAVATLPEKETKKAVELGYDLLDLVEISKIDNRKVQNELLNNEKWQDPNGFDPNRLRQRIATAKRDAEREREKKRLLPEIEKFAKPMTEEQSNARYGNGWEKVRGCDVELKPDAKVIPPKEEGKYYYYEAWGTIEIWQKDKREKHVKSEAEIALEKKQHDAKELNARMKENRIAFVASWKPTRMQESSLKAKLWPYIFDNVSSYNNGDFRVTYHNWDSNLFRQYCGMPKEEDRDKDETIYAEMARRGIPMGRAILAWILCGGVKHDDREGYASQYNGEHKKHEEDLDEVYRILTDNGYQPTDEEQQWKDGTHVLYQEGKQNET